MTCDWGKDGYSVGSPKFAGDCELLFVYRVVSCVSYMCVSLVSDVLPGTPVEGWVISYRSPGLSSSVK
jgi:hypothetical protein